jgi:hypothetical protein
MFLRENDEEKSGEKEYDQDRREGKDERIYFQEERLEKIREVGLVRFVTTVEVFEVERNFLESRPFGEAYPSYDECDAQDDKEK